MLDELCKEFKQRMHVNCTEKKFIWRGLPLLYRRIGDIIRCQNGSSVDIVDEYSFKIIEKLTELFVGCDIMIDPLKTYIIIDWS